jgi:hypothetical protein
MVCRRSCSGGKCSRASERGSRARGEKTQFLQSRVSQCCKRGQASDPDSCASLESSLRRRGDDAMLSSANKLRLQTNWDANCDTNWDSNWDANCDTAIQTGMQTMIPAIQTGMQTGMQTAKLRCHAMQLRTTAIMTGMQLRCNPFANWDDNWDANCELTVMQMYCKPGNCDANCTVG